MFGVDGSSYEAVRFCPCISLGGLDWNGAISAVSNLCMEDLSGVSFLGRCDVSSGSGKFARDIGIKALPSIFMVSMSLLFQNFRTHDAR